jgi:1-aminocyclopropane-1-carboxylate deaminase
MHRFATEKSILQQLPHPDWDRRGIRVLVKRDDLIDPYVSGNKWRKLKYILQLARRQNQKGILTLGGAFSNHLLATAAACREAGLTSIALVRGDELTAESNQNLHACAELGMALHFLPRPEYDANGMQAQQAIWMQRHPHCLFVPEGGAMLEGLTGCQEIWEEIAEPVHHVFVAQGSTTTSCGLLTGAAASTTVHVVPVLKGFDSRAEMHSLLSSLLGDPSLVNSYLRQVAVHAGHHFGGYAKSTPELLDFIRDCRQRWGLPLDRIYTAKAFHALVDAVENSVEFDGATVLFLHTGGLFNG